MFDNPNDIPKVCMYIFYGDIPCVGAYIHVFIPVCGHYIDCVCVIDMSIGYTLFPAWIGNYIQYKVSDEIIYPFPNFNGTAVEVWEWINNFIPHFNGHVIT